MSSALETAVPLDWLIADVLTLIVCLWTMTILLTRTRHPVPLVLEAFGFVFLYAGVFENFAVVQGWYTYGRALLMFGDVPLSVPLIEVTVFLLGLHMLERARLPFWSHPVILGLFAMLQDFSLDPVAVRQVHEAAGKTSGRWTWLIDPGAVANIYRVPVYNFPGWMLIMAYAAVFVLIGRWWFRRSGYHPVVAVVYPILASVLALLAMGSPLSPGSCSGSGRGEPRAATPSGGCSAST